MRRAFGLTLFCIALGAALACAGGGLPQEEEREGEGPGHRSQVLALSPQQELQLGRQSEKQILRDPSKYGRVEPPDSPQSRRIHAVAERIIKAAEIEPLLREMNLRPGYRFEWDLHVLDKDVVNAFCLPGGKIFVFRGILKLVQNDDQLATVISHEMAHALAHHTSERMAREQMNPSASGSIWGKAFDRAQEEEADHIGLFLMTFAGYDPEQAVRFWERMARAQSQNIPEVLSDHPSDERRIQNMQAWVPKALAAKKAFDEGRIAPPRR